MDCRYGDAVEAALIRTRVRRTGPHMHVFAVLAVHGVVPFDLAIAWDTRVDIDANVWFGSCTTFQTASLLMFCAPLLGLLLRATWRRAMQKS